VVEERA